MVRLFIFLAAVALVLLILALISSLSAERVRNMPRFAWVLVILLIPIAGPITWFLTGRPISPSSRPARRPASPDDDPDFLRKMDSEQSRRDRELLAQWEREMGHTDGTGTTPTPGRTGGDSTSGRTGGGSTSGRTGGGSTPGRPDEPGGSRKAGRTDEPGPGTDRAGKSGDARKSQRAEEPHDEQQDRDRP